MINLNEVPSLYQEQVNRFLTYYPRTGQQLAKNYLALVTGPEYTKNPGGRAKKPPIAKKPTPIIESRQDRRKSIILGEISLNPGQNSIQIAKRTGIALTSTRQTLILLTEERLITEFGEERAGYCLSEKTPCH